MSWRGRCDLTVRSACSGATNIGGSARLSVRCGVVWCGFVCMKAIDYTKRHYYYIVPAKLFFLGHCRVAL